MFSLSVIRFTRNCDTCAYVTYHGNELYRIFFRTHSTLSSAKPIKPPQPQPQVGEKSVPEIVVEQPKEKIKHLKKSTMNFVN